MKTISFFIQKGGTGKTTSAVNAARYYTQQGYKVMLVDADPQADATLACGSRPDEEHDLALVLDGGRKAPTLLDVSHFVESEGFWLVPTFSDLENVQIALSQKSFGRFKAMQTALERVPRSLIDLVIVDCPTGFGMLTMSMVVASDYCVIAAKPDAYSLRGICGRPGISGGVYYLLSELGQENHVPTVAGVIATMVEPNTLRHQCGLALLRKDKKGFAEASANLATGEFEEFAGCDLPELLGAVPKFNSMNAKSDLLAAYSPIYARLAEIINLEK